MRIKSRWERRLRSSPVGVLILGALLAFVGAGFLVGGVYLALARRDSGWMVWLSALAVGPLVLYVALHFMRLSRWTWPVMILLLGLLLASSATRAVMAPGAALPALVEIGAEVAALAYLARPRVRRAFGRG